MKAMILAAGLGTRLGPLTANRPKALVEVAGRTLLEITLSRLRTFGITDVIVNVHHFPDMILEYLKGHDNFGLHIEVSREERLLDTGGGLKRASWFFLQDSSHSEEPFLLHNVDVLSTIDLHRMVRFHIEKHALATLAAQHRESSRQLLFDEDLQLCGRRAGRDGKPELVRSHFTNTLHEGDAAKPVPSPRGGAVPIRTERESAASSVPKGEANSGASAPEVRWQALAFSGIHVISPRLFRVMEEEGVFSIIDSYLRLAARGEPILGFQADEFYWRDLGKPLDLAQAAQDLKQAL